MACTTTFLTTRVSFVWSLKNYSFARRAATSELFDEDGSTHPFWKLELFPKGRAGSSRLTIGLHNTTVRGVPIVTHGRVGEQ